MSKHIIHKLFSHGAKTGATSLVINTSKEGLSFNYKFPDSEEQNFSLPGHLGPQLLKELRQILKISDSDLRPDQNFKLKEKKYQLNFSLNIIPNKEGDKVIIRILKKNNKSLNLKQLGFQRENLKELEKINKIKSGLVIISSPEDNGKSTTLQAILSQFNIDSLNAYFLEKNPEYLIPGINYLIPNENNWHKILNHDCDLIIIDDLKSDDDLIKAINAASTGRLVIITTKARSSLEIVLRILKLDLPLKLKIDTLKLIINQRLVDLVRPAKIKNNFKSLEKRTKIAVSELITFNSELKKYLLANGHNHQLESFWKEFNDLINKNNFKSISQDLKKKIENKLVKK
jgi:type II secretory ATPase GspE/PulE/Tfp pilus assembly ATPase PilB-like protein